MALLPDGLGFSEARRAYLAVHTMTEMAMAVARARATNPAAFPTVPTTGTVDWFTQRTMADFLELGFEPDGWETDYFPQARRDN